MTWAERLANGFVFIALVACFGKMLLNRRGDTSSGDSMIPPTDSSMERMAAPKTDVLKLLGLERILVLRVERFRERSKMLEKDAAKLNVPLEFFAATDGHYDVRYKTRILPSIYKRSTCTRLICAIFDTHERAWKVAAQSSKPILILEDDIRLPKNFVDLFEERLAELPKNFNMAFIGSSVRKDSGVKDFSEHVSQLVPHDGSLSSPLLGFWGYILTPKAAKKLLRMVANERHEWVSFEPVDLFVSRRHAKLGQVFIFEPPQDLAADFVRNRDPHHVIESHRQIGIVSLAKVKSLNNGTAGSENDEMDALMKQQVALGESGKYSQLWKITDKGFRKMRNYSCWKAAPLLTNAGLSMLRALEGGEEVRLFSKGLPKLPAPVGRVDLSLRTLLMAYEMFTGSMRFNGGTWLERQHAEEFPQWIRYSMHQRTMKGLPAVDLASVPGGSDRINLPDGFALLPHKMKLLEPLAYSAGLSDRAHEEVSTRPASKVETSDNLSPENLGEFS